MNDKNQVFTDPPVLEARKLTMEYEDGVRALDSLDLNVKKGEIYVMLGGNGAGKTTTINLFLDFIQPTSGEALINSINANTNPLEAKKHVSFVSENVQLYPNFTALQNVDFFTRLSGKSHYSDREYRDVLLRVGLQEEAHTKKLKDFSKGMRQKCGIAIAILKDAPAILLDEPTSGLDPKAGKEFIRLLEDLKKSNKSILMSTHDIFRAREVADTVGILNNGVLVAEHTKKELKGVNLEQLYVKYMAGYMDHKHEKNHLILNS